MKFIATGDSLFSSTDLYKTIDPKLLDILRSADAVFTNAEFVTPREGTAPAAGRGYQTSLRPEALDEFGKLNIKYVGFANNHTGDYGVEGMTDTLHEARLRGIVPLGIGKSLHEANKPALISHKDARIAVITVDITRSEVFAAADSGAGVAARTGVNPLRWTRQYGVNAGDFEAVKAIAARIGIHESMEEGKRVETFASKGEDFYDFGSLFEGYITFKKVDRPGVYTQANDKDKQRILKAVEDAALRSDFVFVNMHTHEGAAENWYSDYPAAFVEEFARSAVNAGADAVIGHGAHFTRGIEIYKDKPIFYNIGSLFMEFEAAQSLISPEMFESYHYSADESPSTLHKNRAKDKDGNWCGFYSHPKYSENFLVEFEIDRDKGVFEYSLIPIDVRLTHEKVTLRGLPFLASSKAAASLAERLENVSSSYGTAVKIDTDRIFIEVHGPW